MLKEYPALQVVALADLSDGPSGLQEIALKDCYVTSDLARIAALPELDAVIDATGNPAAGDRLRKLLNKNVELVDLFSSSFLTALLHSGEQFWEARRLKGELWAVLNSVQDAIEVVDNRGCIKYVNPAFTRVTGIPEEERVNKNIFRVSPHGALAQSLIRQKPVTGYRTRVGGSEAEVISNASPIIVDDDITGAVVVFQPVGDILKLMDELKQSNTLIESLYDQIDQIAGCRSTFDDLSGKSKVFKSTVENARKVSRSDIPVLLSGESGTGKNLFAQAIHNSSTRAGKVFILFDCSRIPESLQELELFGCEKNALPGILRTRMGKLELAQEGTLFLKKIHSLNPYLQNRLLQYMEKRQYYRIGGEKPLHADVRIIASINGDLKDAVLKGLFADDLYRYLAQAEIVVPSLRKRLEDLPLLAKDIIDDLNRKLGKQVNRISPRALQEMSEYDWPGNISELKNVLERSMILADGQIIEYNHLAPYIGGMGVKNVPQIDEVMPLDKMEQLMLKLALARYGETLEGKKQAAQALNISLATLYNKLKRFGDI